MLEAVKNGHLEISSLLIQTGANVNTNNNQGKTILMYAAEYRRTGIVELLISGIHVRNHSSIIHIKIYFLLPLIIYLYMIISYDNRQKSNS